MKTAIQEDQSFYDTERPGGIGGALCIATYDEVTEAEARALFHKEFPEYKLVEE